MCNNYATTTKNLMYNDAVVQMAYGYKSVQDRHITVALVMTCYLIPTFKKFKILKSRQRN